MVEYMKAIIRKITPGWAISLYHYALASAANIWYARPSEKMVVIGVTGTNGKTTTTWFIAQALQACGKKVGLISTAEFQIGDTTWLNDMKMTMPGRFALQKSLKAMVRAGCEYAIIETSSQGVEQYRHIGINYDVIVFTNLTPEHVEAHGGFENYKKAKGKLFDHLARMERKTINGRTIQKVSVINLDDPHASYFLQFSSDKKIGYTLKSSYDIQGVEEMRADTVSVRFFGSGFIFMGEPVHIIMPGKYNVYNAVAALCACSVLGFPAKESKRGLENATVPGRMEFIREGQDFHVVVDYAPEPEGLRNTYNAIQLFEKNSIIHVLGSCGGGRDIARRPIMGEIAGKNARYVIVTNEDPYDDDPNIIIDEVAAGALRAGKIENKNLFKILDRREAIRKAFEFARQNDLVLITGKGCEQAMVVAKNKKIPWDDRVVAREELKNLKPIT